MFLSAIYYREHLRNQNRKHASANLLNVAVWSSKRYLQERFNFAKL